MYRRSSTTTWSVGVTPHHSRPRLASTSLVALYRAFLTPALNLGTRRQRSGGSTGRPSSTR
eukprot:6558844-Prymnesium_polylepis.1